MILSIAIQLCELMLSLAVLIGFFRLVKGPTAVDRIIAFDLVVLTIVAFTALLSIEEQTPHFVELILVVSLLGFFGTIALVRALSSTQSQAEKS
ncbi:MAG TPA: monovalent cation/H+ antiporter complex subunit F [Oceanipulchritudo sp.]|nr:monovalent cation/H+ antiporter complex subunit F [Oceanipulchritudo sp.]